MKVTVLREESWLNCDGCGYTLGRTTQQKQDGVTMEQVTADFRIPWPDAPDGNVVFHFHPPIEADGTPHDCFRYWSHTPRIMEGSLADREWSDEDIAAFMALHLYRRLHGREPEKVVIVQGPPPHGAPEETA